MSKKRKIFAVGGRSYHGDLNWMEGEPAGDMKEADVVAFLGGADIGAELYDKHPHPMTSPDPHRDTLEVQAWGIARSLNKPIIGICRGAQFSCVMSGGILVQHQENMKAVHAVKIDDVNEIFFTSCHHQAAWPWNMKGTDFKVLGWTTGLSRFHHGEHEKQELVNKVVCDMGGAGIDKEVEICYYPHTKALGIQGHPEWFWNKRHKHAMIAESINYCQLLLDRLIAGTL